MKKHSLLLMERLKDLSPLKMYFVENRWSLVLGIISLLSVDFLQLLIPLVVRGAVDGLTEGTANSRTLLGYGGLIMAIALAVALLRYVWRYYLFGLSRKIEEGLRNKLYSNLQSLSLSFYHRTRTGDIMAKAINDINAVRMATGMGLVALTDGTVLGMAAVGFMLYINPSLTLISLIPAPLIVLLMRSVTRRMAAGHEKVQAAFSDVTEGVRETFAGIRVIKAYHREKWADERVEAAGKRYVHENMELAKSVALFFPAMVIFTNIGLAVVICLGGRLTILHHFTAGDFVAFVSYLGLLAWPMMAIGWVTNMMQRGFASMRRINGILREVPEIVDLPVPRQVAGINGRVEFRGVSLAYAGQGGEVIRDLTFSMEAGKTVAIVGRVGAGKTTLLHSIPRLLEPLRGAVLVDGIDVREIPLRKLREGIGFVSQEAMIFSDTVRNNVVFGRRGISEARLEAALRTAYFYEEAQALENGLDTLLGERGITLSGGQRQRLTIARALLSEPPVLILDDALSMVDTRTEEGILTRILGSRQGKTNIIVSNRPSTISRADVIVVLERGEIAEVGDHATLIEHNGTYAHLYERQLLAGELEAI